MKRSSISWRGLLILGLIALALGIIYRSEKSPRSSPPSSDQTAVPLSQSDEEAELRGLSPQEIDHVPRPPAVIQSTSRLSPSAPPPPARAEPTPYTRQLIAGLAQLDLSAGALSQEQAEQWKQRLQALTQQGTAAVPAIREFLEKNLEFNYAGIDGGQLLGQTSLRAALLDALQEIGGPEALDVMIQTLRTTTLPSEIALLAEHLEQQYPGLYRQEMINAVSEVLAMASNGQLPAWDVAPLFQVLQDYGDSTAASMLEELQDQWKYYATLSLAGLEGGNGVPALIRQTTVSKAGAGGKRDFAFQLLAQVATQYPDASAALIEQARLNTIPDMAWRRIVAGLAGDQYQFTTSTFADTPVGARVPGLKTYHIASGNQNFRSVPFGTVATAEEIERRRALIDQLLSVSSNPNAREALQNARASLLNLGQTN